MGQKCREPNMIMYSAAISARQKAKQPRISRQSDLKQNLVMHIATFNAWEWSKQVYET